MDIALKMAEHIVSIDRSKFRLDANAVGARKPSCQIEKFPIRINITIIQWIPG